MYVCFLYENLLEYTPKIVKITENTLAFTDHLVIFTIFGVLSTSVLSVIFTKSTEVLSTGVYSKNSKKLPKIHWHLLIT